MRSEMKVDLSFVFLANIFTFVRNFEKLLSLFICQLIFLLSCRISMRICCTQYYATYTTEHLESVLVQTGSKITLSARLNRKVVSFMQLSSHNIIIEMHNYLTIILYHIIYRCSIGSDFYT